MCADSQMGMKLTQLRSSEQRIERHKRRQVKEVGAGPGIALKSY